MKLNFKSNSWKSIYLQRSGRVSCNNFKMAFISTFCGATLPEWCFNVKQLYTFKCKCEIENYLIIKVYGKNYDTWICIAKRHNEKNCLLNNAIALVWNESRAVVKFNLVKIRQKDVENVKIFCHKINWTIFRKC